MEAICQAIRAHCVIEFQYKGEPSRVVEPHQVGYRQNWNEAELSGYQIGGYSRSGDSPPWRTFKLDEIHSMRISDPGAFSPRYAEGYRPGPNRIFARIICEA